MSNRKKAVPQTTRTNPAATAKATSTTKTTASTPVARAKEKAPLIFKRDNFLLMFLGIGLIALGMFLMSGGQMPDPNTWDPNIIYSTQRTVIAPVVILAGLVVEIFAIFKS
jgi:hypothetical protein